MTNAYATSAKAEYRIEQLEQRIQVLEDHLQALEGPSPPLPGAEARAAVCTLTARSGRNYTGQGPRRSLAKLEARRQCLGTEGNGNCTGNSAMVCQKN
jgi:hypothetical protein